MRIASLSKSRRTWVAWAAAGPLVFGGWITVTALAAPPPISLQAQLDARRRASDARTPPEAKRIMEKDLTDLRRAALRRHARRTGEPAPDFALPDARGGSVQLRELLRQGPVILTFYRGAWCPYCNLQLRAYQKSLAEFTRLGARLVAISPERPDLGRGFAEKNALAFAVLSDVGLRVAQDYGLVFTVSPELRKVYRGFGIDLANQPGGSAWRLPLPATYVIGQDGRSRFAFVDEDYRRRAEPAAIIAALKAIHAERVPLDSHP